MKNAIVTVGGVIGGWLSYILGGWTLAMQTLLTFMIVDYITGIMVAVFWQNSPKTETGGLNSKVGFKGLCKKVAILFMVAVAHSVDIFIGTSFLKDGVIVGYCINEFVSILENASLMGIDNKYLSKILDVLEKKNEDKEG